MNFQFFQQCCRPFSIESTEKSLIFLNSVVILKCKWMETYLGDHGLAYLPLQKRPQEKYHTCGFPLGKKYRSHFEIIALIVEAVKDSGQAKFSIMKHSNINCGQLNKFLFSLVEMGFIEQCMAEWQTNVPRKHQRPIVPKTVLRSVEHVDGLGERMQSVCQ